MPSYLLRLLWIVGYLKWKAREVGSFPFPSLCYLLDIHYFFFASRQEVFFSCNGRNLFNIFNLLLTFLGVRTPRLFTLWHFKLFYIFSVHYDVQMTRASTEDYISIKGKKTSMTSLTICTWIKTRDLRTHAAFISYAIKGGSSNAIVLNNPQSLWFWIESRW